MADVCIPGLLREMTGGAANVTAPGETVGQVIDYLEKRYPGIQSRLCEKGELRSNLVVAVDGEIKPLGLKQLVAEGSEIRFIYKISGG